MTEAGFRFSGLAVRAGVAPVVEVRGAPAPSLEISGVVAEPVMDGRPSVAAALEATILACGGSVDAQLVADSVTLDGALIRDLTVLHEDTCRSWRSCVARDVRTAFCQQLLRQCPATPGRARLVPLVDELILSCEVGAAKPRPKIFEVALDVATLAELVAYF